MKIIIFLLMISLVQVSAKGLAQRISLVENNVPVEKVLQSIKTQSGYGFIYDVNDLKGQRISVNLKNVTIEEAVRATVRYLPLAFKIVKSNIVLIKVETKMETRSLDRTISGSVVDEKGTPLISVNIRVKNANISASTDIKGKFKIDVPIGKDTLMFTSIGFIDKEVAVKSTSTIVVTMVSVEESLEEVLVVGFGTQKKISNVGAQATVKAKDLKLPVRNLSTSLLGRLGGVTGMQRSGEPGNDDADIFIRGIATLNRELSKPLILVDGVERLMNDIDPEDIESFTLLKDAAATAVYGVRGANGVIIITTKRGVQGKTKIKARYSEGVSTFTKIPELVDGVSYMNMANEASLTRGGGRQYTDERIQNTLLGNDPYLYPNVNWMDEIFNKYASNRNVNVTMSGGSQFVTYYFSTGYYRDNGILKSDEMAKYNSNLYLDRYNFTSNIQANLTKTTLIDLGIQGNIKNRNLPGMLNTSDIFDQVMRIPPIYHPVIYPDGKLAQSLTNYAFNPYNSLTQSGYRTQWSNQLYSNLRITQKLDSWVKGLSATGMFSFDANNLHENKRTKTPDTWIATGRDNDGNLVYDQTTFATNQYLGFTTSSSGTRQFYLEGAVNYTGTFGKHDVGGMLLYNQRDYVTTGGNLITSLPYRSKGVAARLNYAYNYKYMAELNFGYNGSENFMPKSRYGFFPSMGLGWAVSEESFFEPLKNAIQFLKFRFTHGLVGNSNIGGRRFAYIGTVNTVTGYNFGLGDVNNKFTGLEIGEYPVDVTWETSTKTNLGLETKLLNSRLSFQIDFFNEKREGIFLRRTSLPNYLGILNEPYGNLGVVKNRGVDLTTDFSDKIGNVSLQFQGNFSFARNTILENDEPDRLYPWMEREGRRVNQRFGYTALGLFKDASEILTSAVQTGDVRPGDLKFQDLNNDGKIDQYDMGPIGYGDLPEIVYGFGLTVGYKGFNVGAFFQGAANVDIAMYGEGFQPFLSGSERGNLFSAVNDRWTPENPNPNAFYPRLAFGSLNDNYTTNSWFTKSANYLRLKTLQLGYDIPDRLSDKLKLGKSRIFFIATNVLTFSKFDLWDVELGNGLGTSYPNMSTYSLGIELNF
ncbi:MAG: SusC/RagA family TonB-linked outer membrane protein [Pedobacter sp.]|uniref:SusC/RagA family TonB-linked outer membrane protein n=1 Tax=Pedobacter sp. TaxID=1411316 RepID=UPI003562C2BE